MVNDGVSTFKSNPYGQKSLQLVDSVYQTFAAPVLPWFSRPYQYVSPYVKKADDLGDKTLSKVDEKFPVVKKPTNEIINDGKTLVYLPVRIGQTGKEHVMNTYDSERRKAGGDDIISYTKAALTTVLVITTDTLTTVSNFLSNKKGEVRQAIDEKANN